MITIYTTPTCIKCKALKKACEDKGIELSYVDITQDFKAHAKLLAAGLMAVPVVELESGEIISDFNEIKTKVLES